MCNDSIGCWCCCHPGYFDIFCPVEISFVKDKVGYRTCFVDLGQSVYDGTMRRVGLVTSIEWNIKQRGTPLDVAGNKEPCRLVG